MTNQKKKKVRQLLERSEELTGSTDYIASHEIDQIIKKGRDRIKHAITVSDEKLTKTKKQIVREMAQDLEKVGYPVNQICDRLTKSLKGLVSERTVRELDSKYKNPEQSEVAKMQQNHDGGSLYRQQEQVSKKDYKEVTFEDIKFLNPSKAKQVAKYQMSRALWWEQQAKQNKQQEEEKQIPAMTTKQQDHRDEDKDRIIADLKEKQIALKDGLKYAKGIIIQLLDKKIEERYIVARVRPSSRKWLKEYEKYVDKITKSKPKRKSGSAKTPLEKEKRELLQIPSSAHRDNLIRGETETPQNGQVRLVASVKGA